MIAIYKNWMVLFIVSCYLFLVSLKAEDANSLKIENVIDQTKLQWEIRCARSNFMYYGYNNEPVICSSNAEILLISGSQLSKEFQLKIDFRVVANRGSSLKLYFGVQNEKDLISAALEINLVGNLQADVIRWGIISRAQNGWSTNSGSYYLKVVPSRSLGWPENVYKRVESDMASSLSLKERITSLRILHYSNLYQIYLDDRLLAELESKELNLSGLTCLKISPGTELYLVKVEADDMLITESGRFVPLEIKGYVNANEVCGALIDYASLGKNKSVEVGGIPFILSNLNFEGNSHISLEPSWLFMGGLEGVFSPNTEGRWAGAMYRTPSRIQIRIPKRNYSRIHLLAAFDNETNKVPIVTAQFYRPASGFPKNFSTEVPSIFSAAGQGNAGIPIKFKDGRDGTLHLVSIPVDTALLKEFKDMPFLEMELTKEVKLYRCYPDPAYYSFHQGGLPSGVHIFGITLEKSAVEVDFSPSKFTDVWTEPDMPVYRLTLLNGMDNDLPVKAKLILKDSYGKEAKVYEQDVKLSRDKFSTNIKFKPERYGHHTVELMVEADNQVIWQEERTLAYLRKDTRERGNWQMGCGPLFGFWFWRGAHGTPGDTNELLAMWEAGMETVGPNSIYVSKSESLFELFEKNKMITPWLLKGGGHNYIKLIDPSNAVETVSMMIKKMKEEEIPLDKAHKPRFVAFFSEPGLGPVSYGNVLAEYWDGKPYEMTEAEKKKFEAHLAKFLIGAPAIRKEWPDLKFLIPWGTPMYTVPFLRYSEEARKLIDGVALDFAQFERVPEQQLHQCSLNMMWVFHQEWKKAKKEAPILIAIEGPCIAPVLAGALTEDEQADYTVRSHLALLAYGTSCLMGGTIGFTPSSYWGEQHYGAGTLKRMSLYSPFKSYAAVATMTRHLNRMNFEKWLPIGSLSTYCLKFKHYKDDRALYVMWTIRGKRSVMLENLQGAQKNIEVYDEMDNVLPLEKKEGVVSFWIDSSPCYIYGLTSEPKIVLGAVDHSDALPEARAISLGNFGDGTWKISNERDDDYEESHKEFVLRRIAKMSVRVEDVAEKYGRKALAIHFDERPDQPIIMPYYTSLVPEKPVIIPGKASHIGVWAKAASDWGRIIYCLKDAKGERWISVGSKGSWNNDDIHHKSVFCFDDWRYLRFELPANLPYDSYREAGSTWWGHYGKGDGIVDLPLTLEKVIVERRNAIIYVNDVVETSTKDVLLGSFFAEYEKEEDKGEGVIKLSHIRMEVADVAGRLSNPIDEMREKGTLPALKIQAIKPPAERDDGTMCYVHFEEVPDALEYEVFVSPYEDGRGALSMTKGIKRSGVLIRGLKPEKDFYAFIVYKNKEGKISKPSQGFKFRLKDTFGMK